MNTKGEDSHLHAKERASEEDMLGTSLVVWWLRLSSPNVGSPGSAPG